MQTQTRPTADLHPDYANFYPVISPLIMGVGVGDGKITMCLVAQAACINALRKGLTLDKPTDEMECACPLLCRLAIRLNDGGWWKDDMERTEILRPLIPLLLDSKQSKDVTLKRVYFVADNCVRMLTPMRLRFMADHVTNEERKKLLNEGASKLESLNPIIDKESSIAAREVCLALRKAAYAYAAAAAAAYADAAAAAAEYAYAYAAAAAYADAATAAAAYAAAQRIKYRDELLKLFRQVASIVE